MNLEEMMPFLIPLMIVQFLLLGYTLYHILTHNTYKRGSRILWLAIVIVGMQFWGPVLYFVLGREEG